MRTVLTPKQMGAVDRYMIERMKIPGILLMENAAHSVYEAIREETEPCSVQVFCGTGNNGGDGFAVARILLANGYDVTVVLMGNPSSLQGDAAENFAFFKETKEYYTVVTNKEEFEALPEAEIYVDAIFGTGLSRDVEGIYRSAVEFLSEQDALVVSVDIPSGISAETGAVMGAAVRADITVTFQYPKIGHFLYPGREYAGELRVVRIGVDDGCDIPLQSTVCAYESDDPDMCLGERPLDSNKGSYGKLLLVAGSYGMAGAAVLSARAASRAGAGLVTAASCGDVIGVLQQNVPEATCFEIAGENGVLTKEAIPSLEKLVQGKTAIAVGPGLGVNEDVTAVVGNLIMECGLPKVVDADGLNALAGHLDLLENKQGEVILTPHPKEFSRLSGLPTEEILKDPVKAAVNFAVEYGVTLVLKGSTTIVADQFGNASLLCVGTPGMAKGGSGDVLTGVIGGLLAQGKDVYEAALTGVYIAGMAGELAAQQEGEYSMTPMDTVNHIGQAMNAMVVDYIAADTAHGSGGEADIPRRLPRKMVEVVTEQIETPVFGNSQPKPEPVAEEEPEVPETEEDAGEELWRAEEPEPVSGPLAYGEAPEEMGAEEEPTRVVAPMEEERRPLEPSMDFLEKYADEPEEPMTRSQRRLLGKTQEREKSPLFRRKEKREEIFEESEVTPQDVIDDVMDELPPEPKKGPTRRKIG
ncbi:bifunctional ADP-dependent NAD(P)H-hydrate dehydratase/NAD(P)H-hydrate epimerase [Christensenella intestinihominis]|uniref:bifunctional ADP-dependent NAD(P)H-hydrate dehydratase/NAD(P)H-hydrate epimerase n=1 Tax=Christensenella intestinihominis TaxID=1851429 RepID=UPI000833E755|nr:bifunctional ADP-dependent NAD(P)H-hydrate dehydratase/NAD(P)H-hydrate epimerase [Christensenella intestinihominis]